MHATRARPPSLRSALGIRATSEGGDDLGPVKSGKATVIAAVGKTARVLSSVPVAKFGAPAPDEAAAMAAAGANFEPAWAATDHLSVTAGPLGAATIALRDLARDAAVVVVRRAALSPGDEARVAPQ